MSYVEENLIAGENLVFRTGLHWTVLVWPLLAAVVVAGGGVVCLLQRDTDVMFAGAFLFVVAGIIVAFAILKRNAVEIAVTNRRVMIKTGMLSRRSLEIMLPKVESIGIDETMMGRVLGYGTVVIHGTGGTPEPFRRIAHPSEFRREVQEQLDSGQPK
ncbi:MAG TPA: PH domain-containing protein [Candidatus Acidoferrales bacterium]|nr:PH domain-containing protein [Candidatus Acidoferrales bacterium]